LKRTELLTRFEPSYRLVQEMDQEIEQAKASIAGEALTPVRDETSDKDPNYEWARMELERRKCGETGCRRVKLMPWRRFLHCGRSRSRCRPVRSISRI